MSLSAVATFFVLPPGNLVGTALVGAALSFRTRRVGQWIALLSVAALAVLSMPLVAAWLTFPLEQGLPLQPDPAHPPQAIVVLSAEVDRLADGTSGVGMLTLERVRAGAALARRTGLPLLVSGGYTGDDTADACAVMADSLHADFGLDVRWRECRSTDTWENAAMSAALLKPDGIQSIYLVTHAWHMPRALLAFRPTGLLVTAAPTLLDATPRPQLEGLVPGARAMQRSYWSLHEWVGLLDYRLRLLMQ